MDFIKQTHIIKLTKSTSILESSAMDSVITEERIAFYLNGAKLLSVMSIPYEQDCHIVGFLMSEGVLDSINDITSLHISDDGLSVYITANIDESKLANLHKEKTLTSGCCVGVSANFSGEVIKKDITSPLRLSADEVFKLMDLFSSSTKLFAKTGCVHKAMLVIKNLASKTIATIECEDIGRHNAIDKAIGKARLSGFDTANSILLVSGRLSLEMTIKAAMHNIPILISRAATTNLAINAARKLGISLIGFARDKTLNIYTHPNRIEI